ncbi:MAG: methylenetetrahydrofolate--tRNA-(uracil(54)-C(5))-methyltransferase (FADH(2)-oxidizing) TrmFO [Pseudomonadota bacterium]
MTNHRVTIIGAGLAGSEAAWQAAEAGADVTLFEMRPRKKTDAHQTDGFAELVCSNSFRSDDATGNAVGLLHEEMRRAGSLIMRAGDLHKVPAGAALAVDRDRFSAEVTASLKSHPNISIHTEEMSQLPSEDFGQVVIATGPLTSDPLADAIKAETGEDELAFFDAIAPIIAKESIDFDVAWFQSRYDKAGPGGDGADYINCPMNEAEYEGFIDALLNGETTEFKEWEQSTPYFEGCLPIEVMAARGRETLRFGPMKPVGLTDPRTGNRPHAVVQLRQDNALGTLYNIVGFQTKLKYGAQKAVFTAIPGLANAEFVRLGGIHRNTFINSPRVLDGALRLKSKPHIRFAGQITGVEGYVESAAIGLVAGKAAAADALGMTSLPPPQTTALGALIDHVTGGHLGDAKKSFQPMNINFGLMPQMDAPSRDAEGRRLRGKEKSRAKKKLMAARALDDVQAWVNQSRAAAQAAE